MDVGFDRRVLASVAFPKLVREVDSIVVDVRAADLMGSYKKPEELHNNIFQLTIRGVSPLLLSA